MPSARTSFRIFKWSVYGLLAADIGLFVLTKGMAEVIDQIGWVLLIVTFEYETTSLDQDYAGRWEKFGLIAVQVLAYGLILDATWQYIVLAQWLDVVNAVTWLLVCAVLAYDVYYPGGYGRLEWRIRNGIKVTLYAVLVGCVAAWGLEQDWVNAWDALLWLLCFAVVELNIFRFETEESAAALAAESGQD